MPVLAKFIRYFNENGKGGLNDNVKWLKIKIKLENQNRLTDFVLDLGNIILVAFCPWLP